LKEEGIPLNVNLTALSVSIFDGDGGGLVLDDLHGFRSIADNKMGFY
jgi:hypothetical protein